MLTDLNCISQIREPALRADVHRDAISIVSSIN